MDAISSTCSLFAVLMALAIFIAGLKASLLHNGPGAFELIGMLWRGEIKTRN